MEYAELPEEWETTRTPVTKKIELRPGRWVRLGAASYAIAMVIVAVVDLCTTRGCPW
jgi:hypothetical protein